MRHELARRIPPRTLQRAPARGASGSDAAPPIVHEVLASSGQPLGSATRSFMEPRLGIDLGGVRVHSDSKANDSARAVNALAYTVGKDIVFGAQQYHPATQAGGRLLAHELTHVAQQNTGGPWQLQGLAPRSRWRVRNFSKRLGMLRRTRRSALRDLLSATFSIPR